MRVIYDVYRDGLAALNAAKDQLARAQEQVSTGRRINAAGDDPLGTQQAILERDTMSTIDAYTRSADSASARLASADSVLTAYSDKLTSAITTAVGAQGTQVTDAARSAAAENIRSLRDALLSDLNTTFNGTYLFSGTNATSATYAQVGGAWTYQGNNTTTKVAIQSGQSVAVSFDGQSIAQGSDSTDVFTSLDTLATAIQSGDTAGISAGLDALQRAFDRAQRAQGSLGADEQSVTAATTQLSSLRVAADTRRSKLEDANLAAAITQLSQADTAYQAALGAVSTAERQSLLDYLK
jgi:flagellar hook-associated protein 3 FlgL